MNKEEKQLFIPVLPQPEIHEDLISWLIRLAAGNGARGSENGFLSYHLKPARFGSQRNSRSLKYSFSSLIPAEYLEPCAHLLHLKMEELLRHTSLPLWLIFMSPPAQNRRIIQLSSWYPQYLLQAPPALYTRLTCTFEHHKLKAKAYWQFPGVCADEETGRKLIQADLDALFPAENPVYEQARPWEIAYTRFIRKLFEARVHVDGTKIIRWLHKEMEKRYPERSLQERSEKIWEWMAQIVPVQELPVDEKGLCKLMNPRSTALAVKDIHLMALLLFCRECTDGHLISSLKALEAPAEQSLWQGYVSREWQLESINPLILFLRHSATGRSLMIPCDLARRGMPLPYEQEERSAYFKRLISRVDGGDYELISDFQGMNRNVQIRHRPCGKVFTIQAQRFLLNGQGCPCVKIWTDSVFQAWLKDHDSFEMTAPLSGRGSYARVHLKSLPCGHTFDSTLRTFVENPVCPVCVKYRSSQKRFEKLLMEKYGDEYSLAGQWVNFGDKVQIRHNLCQRVYWIHPTKFLQGSAPCLFCYGRKIQGKKESRIYPITQAIFALGQQQPVIFPEDLPFRQDDVNRTLQKLEKKQLLWRLEPGAYALKGQEVSDYQLMQEKFVCHAGQVLAYPIEDFFLYLIGCRQQAPLVESYASRKFQQKTVRLKKVRSVQVRLKAAPVPFDQTSLWAASLADALIHQRKKLDSPWAKSCLARFIRRHNLSLPVILGQINAIQNNAGAREFIICLYQTQLSKEENQCQLI